MGEGGNYRLAKPIESTQVPATVQAVLAARIDRLPPGEKRLLQSAAVIGKDVPLVILQAIADQSEEEISRGLSLLRQRNFSTRQVSSLRLSTRLSTHSHMKLLTVAFYKSGGVRFMRGLSRLSNSFILIAWSNRLSGWRIMRYGASYGKSHRLPSSGRKKAASTLRYSRGGHDLRAGVGRYPSSTGELEKQPRRLLASESILVLLLIAATGVCPRRRLKKTYSRARDLCEQFDATLATIPRVVGAGAGARCKRGAKPWA